MNTVHAKKLLEKLLDMKDKRILIGKINSFEKKINTTEQLNKQVLEYSC